MFGVSQRQGNHGGLPVRGAPRGRDALAPRYNGRATTGGCPYGGATRARRPRSALLLPRGRDALTPRCFSRGRDALAPRCFSRGRDAPAPRYFCHEGETPPLRVTFGVRHGSDQRDQFPGRASRCSVLPGWGHRSAWRACGDTTPHQGHALSAQRSVPEGLEPPGCPSCGPGLQG